jgi:predicted O-methyltransferase YrrM
MRYEQVAKAVHGIPWMTPEQGRRVHDHIRETGARDALDLGTAHGVSAAYIAAAVEANGGGRVTSVAWRAEQLDPRPQDVLGRAGLADLVDLVEVDDSSYDWFLREQVASRSDAAGNCDPIYDFCYLDGAHDFTIDGLAVVLVEKLLRPGGWLLLDDLDWTYERWLAEWLPDAGTDPRAAYPLSDAERREPGIRAVFDLIVRQHPSFTEFREEDGRRAWARKAPGESRRYRLETSRSVGAMALGALRRLGRR